MTQDEIEQQEPEELPAIDDDPGDLVDHPDEVDDEEAEAGLRVYRAVDDLDDESDGLDAL
jgi:hypothetical protein